MSRPGLARRIGANRVVVALSVARMADALGNSVLFIIIPLYVTHLPAPSLRLPETVLVGFLVALYGLMNTVAQPFAGALIDRLNRRKPFIQAGLLLMAAGTLLFVFATSYLHLVLIRLVQGIGVALTVPASMALMTLGTERQTRGGSMGVYTTARLVGLTTGPLVGGWLYDHFGFNSTFYTGAAFIALGFLLVQVWVPEQRTPPPTPGTPPPAFRLFDRSLASPGILAVGIATFVMAAAFTLMVPLEKQFNARIGSGAFGFGIAFSSLMLSRLLLQIPLGRLSDQVGRKPLVILGLVLMAPATALLGVAHSVASLSVFRVVQGVGSAAVAAPAFALAADLSRAGGEGRQLSVVTMGFGLGIALGPLLAGLLAVAFFELPFLVGGALALSGAAVVWRYVTDTTGRHALDPVA